MSKGPHRRRAGQNLLPPRSRRGIRRCRCQDWQDQFPARLPRHHSDRTIGIANNKRYPGRLSYIDDNFVARASGQLNAEAPSGATVGETVVPARVRCNSGFFQAPRQRRLPQGDSAGAIVGHADQGVVRQCRTSADQVSVKIDDVVGVHIPGGAEIDGF